MAMRCQTISIVTLMWLLLLGLITATQHSTA